LGRKTAELPKDEPTVGSAFLFVALSPKMAKYRFRISEATEMLKKLLKNARLIQTGLNTKGKHPFLFKVELTDYQGCRYRCSAARGMKDVE